MNVTVQMETQRANKNPGRLLRLEGVVLFLTAILLYAQQDGSWGRFALLFLLPDLGMLGYLANPSLGALLYNSVHTTVSPLLLAGFALLSGQLFLLPLALIWLAHIGADRALGYGLKYDDDFKHSHLEEV